MLEVLPTDSKKINKFHQSDSTKTIQNWVVICEIPSITHTRTRAHTHTGSLTRASARAHAHTHTHLVHYSIHEPPTDPCPVPLSIYLRFTLIFSSHLYLSIPNALSLQVFRLKFCVHAMHTTCPTHLAQSNFFYDQ
jgi:hypothetical protein